MMHAMCVRARGGHRRTHRDSPVAFFLAAPVVLLEVKVRRQHVSVLVLQAIVATQSRVALIRLQCLCLQSSGDTLGGAAYEVALHRMCVLVAHVAVDTLRDGIDNALLQ